jgi:hypothetical protein
MSGFGWLWFVVFAAAGLCYPRQPRLTGILFVVLSVFPLVGNGNPLAIASGGYCITQGLWLLYKFRDPDVRAKHVAYWTAKA